MLWFLEGLLNMDRGRLRKVELALKWLIYELMLAYLKILRQKAIDVVEHKGALAERTKISLHRGNILLINVALIDDLKGDEILYVLKDDLILGLWRQSQYFSQVKHAPKRWVVYFEER